MSAAERVTPLDPMAALRIIRDQGCERFTDSIGSCIRDGLSPVARYLDEQACMPCVAWAGLLDSNGEEPAEAIPGSTAVTVLVHPDGSTTVIVIGVRDDRTGEVWEVPDHIAKRGVDPLRRAIAAIEGATVVQQTVTTSPWREVQS